jgi:hypothetical protein
LSTEVEKSEKFPLLGAIALSTFLGIFGTVWLHLLPAGLYNFYNFGIIICSIEFISAPFILLLITKLFATIGPMRGKISLSTLTSVYIVGQTSAWYLAYYSIWNVYGRIFTSRIVTPADSNLYVPWFMAPESNIVSQILTGHLPVPWGEWFISFLFWWAYQVVFALFMVSVATLFRRAWIDVEKVPFPQTLVAHEMIGKEAGVAWPRPFMIGILLGLVFQIPVFMSSIFSWFPDIYGWRTVCGGGEWYVTSDNALASIAGFAAFNKHPVIIAIAYLIPLSVLFSTWFFYIVYMVIVQIAFVTGSYTGEITKGGCGRAWCAPGPQYTEPLKFTAISFAGGMLGLGLYYLIANRRYLSETIGAAIGRISNDRIREIERNEPMSYRMSYLMLALSSILVIILLMVIGLGIVASLVMLATILVLWIANGRAYGMTAVPFLGDDHGHVLFRFLWPSAPQPLTREWVWSIFISRLGVARPSEMWLGSIMFAAFGNYKMASLTGFSNKKALWLTIIPIIIVPIVVMITWLQLQYYFGGSIFPVTQVYTYSTISPSQAITDPAMVYVKPGSEPLAPYVLAGMIIVCALSYLHATFLWFPLEPIGFIMGTTFMSLLWGLWGPFLLAWIIKMMTLRIGGSKTYEHYGVPIAAGFIAGYMVAILVGGTLSVIRFFIPY